MQEKILQKATYRYGIEDCLVNSKQCRYKQLFIWLEGYEWYVKGTGVEAMVIQRNYNCGYLEKLGRKLTEVTRVYLQFCRTDNDDSTWFG